MFDFSEIIHPKSTLTLKTKDGYKTITRSELLALSQNFAQYLINEIKITKGETVAILSESMPEFPLCLFGIMQAGAIAVPLDTKLTAAELGLIIKDCSARILCCSNTYLNTAFELRENTGLIQEIFLLDDKEKYNKMGTDRKEQPQCKMLPDETALIIYTSGTMGQYKGVMVSYGNIYSQLVDYKSILKLKEKNTALSILPLNHLLELVVGCFGALYLGVEIVYLQTLNPKEIKTAMKEKQVTVMLVVPLFLKMLKSSMEKEIKKHSKFFWRTFSFMQKTAKYLPQKLKRQIFKPLLDELGGKLDYFICGGAPLDIKTAKFWDNLGIPVYGGYGLTEAGPVVSTNYFGKNRYGSVGKPLPSVFVKISEENEILIKGPNVMQGYYKKPCSTLEIIDKNNWLHTGDMGKIDKDGYLYITGRLKNVIVLENGKKVFPEEVEAVLEKSLLIKELCVIPLKILFGAKAGREEIGLIVVPDDILVVNNDEDVEKLLHREIKFLAKKYLAPYKNPTTIIISKEELPKTSTRKIKRIQVQKLYGKG